MVRGPRLDEVETHFRSHPTGAARLMRGPASSEALTGDALKSAYQGDRVCQFKAHAPEGDSRDVTLVTGWGMRMCERFSHDQHDF